MEICGKVYLMFEQSGVFKNEFRKLGYEAFDYDIQNNFGETDYQIDLFTEIESACGGGKSIFDNITGNDLIIGFFPCVEFSCVSQMWYSLSQRDYAKWAYMKRIEYMVKKNQNRAHLFELLLKFCGLCLDREIRMILENPWSEQTYLKQNVFLKPPSIIDKDRTLRGDYFKKPTAYWFWNCEPTYGRSLQQTPHHKVNRIDRMKKAPHAGLCSEERSMISPDYARNFICDFILGREQVHTERMLFDDI